MAKGFHARDYQYQPTEVTFCTTDERLQQAYDKGVAFLSECEIQYNDRRVIREGANYTNVWLETQPMAGEMYAKRNFEVGLNNILIFLQYQRKDGRFPGMISDSGRGKGIVGHYDWIQGFYFALPALKMAYLLKKDRGYLEKLYDALASFDDYLWTHRDSDADGCLEVWCCWDTAEDNCTRYLRHGAPDNGNGAFGGEIAPTELGDLPMESPEYMNYSYTCRDILSKISAMLDNGKEDYWRQEAEKVRKKTKEYLWLEDEHALFYRDRNDNVIPCLDHTTLRAMYHGLVTPEMADDFLYYHLFNPEEFWTPCPLTAVAANNEYFLNNERNNWSGSCQGLIYQRAIDAFHNYGHYAEAAVVGRHVVDLCRKHQVFHQQYDPFTGEPDPRKDGYGPMIFAFTEYLSYLWGVNISMNQVHWSNAKGGADCEYTQKMFGKTYTLTVKNGIATAYLNGEELFSFSAGVRIVTDLSGRPLKGICIDEDVTATLWIEGYEFTAPLEPNGVYGVVGGKPAKIGGAKYFKPGVKPE